MAQSNPFAAPKPPTGSFGFQANQPAPYQPPQPPQSATGSRGAPISSFDAYNNGTITPAGPTSGAPSFGGSYGMDRQLPGAPAAPAAPTNPDNNLLVKGDRETFYGDTSQEYKDPSRSERLVDQGMDGFNDYYEFANNKLNDQFAAMGGGPSGALLRASQQLRANQAHEMMGYANTADQIHYGRLGAGQHAAGSSDAGQLERLGLGFGSAERLGNDQANATRGFYGDAASSANPFTAEAINSDVQKSTINPEQNMVKDALSIYGAYRKGKQP